MAVGTLTDPCWVQNTIPSWYIRDSYVGMGGTSSIRCEHRSVDHCSRISKTEKNHHQDL